MVRWSHKKKRFRSDVDAAYDFVCNAVQIEALCAGQENVAGHCLQVNVIRSALVTVYI